MSHPFEGIGSSLKDDSQNLLSQVASSLICACIAVHLADCEVSVWARCNRRSLAQLQQYALKRPATALRMLSLMPERRGAAAFGRVSHVQITTAQEWTLMLPSLPPFVQCVTIDISSSESEQLDSLYRSTKVAFGEGDIGGRNSSVCLPCSVRELYFKSRPDKFSWPHSLRISSDSCLRVVEFPELVPGWKALPHFIRRSLPDTVMDLRLPRSFSSFADANPECQPSAEYYPVQWPPNLTKLRIASHIGSPFAVGNLPHFPPTLTSIRTMTLRDRVDAKSVQRMLQQFPDSITSLELFKTGSDSMDGSWKLPAGLLSLRLHMVKQIFHEPIPFTFPSGLRELQLRNFSQPEMLSALLPVTLTSLMLNVPSSIAHPFKNMQWPSQLRTLEFQLHEINTVASLHGWIPPPHLTKLNLGDWNMPLFGLALPSTLRTLVLSDFSHSLVGVIFPSNLEHLQFTSPAKSPLLSAASWHPPVQLQSLTLAKYHDEPLFLPPSLTRFVAGCNYYPSSFKLVGESLPQGLHELDMRSSQCCRHPLDTLLMPPNLRILRIWANRYLIPEFSVARFPAQLPASLRLFHVSECDVQNGDRLKIVEWASKVLPVHCSLLFE